MSLYATLLNVKDFGVMPSEDIDELERRDPGITERISTMVSALFDAKLIKRYAAPFEEPYPDVLVYQVSQAVTYHLYLKRGFNPSSAQDAEIKAKNDAAWAWLDEAANAKEGLVELPRRQESPPGGGAVNVGGPLSYSEENPYTWMRRQRERARGGFR
ncbi:phage protein Gp36 family protein [Sorangium sp. So ce834]|uniref:phage protein Gp36 family protein n=1 Tax=Sorangium sp. So ce834 TaxID=3133321 RepID=UPI003F6243A2